MFREEDIGQRIIVGGAYFPVIGLILACLLWLLTVIASPFLPPFVLAALLVVAQILLTGGLHLDGLMDSCDGLFGGRTAERKLEIMRDSRVGSFGVLGAACILLLRFSCLASLNSRQIVFALLLAMPTARWCMAFALYLFPNARNNGLGNIYRQAVTREHVIIAGMISLVITIIAGRVIGILIWAVLTGVAFVLGKWITGTIGGLTGDTYGAIEEVTDVIALLLVVILHSFL
jgi:adenosylcobinamide-GDP ribazoletransferase